MKRTPLHDRLNQLHCAVLLSMLPVFLLSGSRPAEAQQPEDFRDAIRVAIGEFIAADSVVVRRPEFTIADQTVYYSLGRVNSEALGLDGDPLHRVVEAQLRVEAIREAFRPSDVASSLVESSLKRADSLILVMLDLIIAAERDTIPVSVAELETLEAAVESEFSAARDSIVEFAQDRGMRASRTDRGLASVGFFVPVATNPAGGSVRVLPFLEYRVYQARGRSADQMPWRTLGAAEEELIGRYYFRVTWPGRPLESGTFQVRSANPIVLPRR